jgi:FkbM family methyltransferase
LRKTEFFLDIGANFGVWAVPLAKHLEPKGGQVLAFEGTLETYYVLGANVILNGLHNILTFNNIVTNVDMSFKTQIIPYYNDHSLNIGAQSVLKTEIIHEYGLGGHDGERSFQYRDSKGVQLDVLYRSGEIPSCPIFMKLDVELHELQVLQGSLRLLQDCRPFLFVEMNCENMNKSILKLLDSLGYISFWIGLPFVHYTDAVERSGLSLEFIMSSVNILAVPRAKALGVASRFPNVLVTIDLLRADYHILSSYSIRSCKNAPPGEEAECVIMKQDSNWVCDQISPALTNYWQRL